MHTLTTEHWICNDE